MVIPHKIMEKAACGDLVLIKTQPDQSFGVGECSNGQKVVVNYVDKQGDYKTARRSRSFYTVKSLNLKKTLFMENFLLSLDRKKQIKMLEDALKEDRFDIFKTLSQVLLDAPLDKGVGTNRSN